MHFKSYPSRGNGKINICNAAQTIRFCFSAGRPRYSDVPLRILELLNFPVINYRARSSMAQFLPRNTATINLNTLLKSIIQLMNWGFSWRGALPCGGGIDQQTNQTEALGRSRRKKHRSGGGSYNLIRPGKSPGTQHLQLDVNQMQTSASAQRDANEILIVNGPLALYENAGFLHANVLRLANGTLRKWLSPSDGGKRPPEGEEAHPYQTKSRLAVTWKNRTTT